MKPRHFLTLAPSLAILAIQIEAQSFRAVECASNCTSAIWEKLKCGKSPKIVADYKDGPMLVSTPEEVEGEIAKIPEGHVITLTQLRSELARQHGATLICPMSTAIFINIVARAHVEREAETGKPGVPWWRVLQTSGKLNDKYPAGAAEQTRRLRLEALELDSQPQLHIARANVCRTCHHAKVRT